MTPLAWRLIPEKESQWWLGIKRENKIPVGLWQNTEVISFVLYWWGNEVDRYRDLGSGSGSATNMLQNLKASFLTSLGMASSVNGRGSHTGLW